MGLQGKLSGYEFAQIVAALNDTCRDVGPSMGEGSRGLTFEPFLGIGFHTHAHSKFNTMNEALHARCNELSNAFAKRGKRVNVRFVSAGTTARHSPRMTHIDIEVC
jgi:hypothetical protein